MEVIGNEPAVPLPASDPCPQCTYVLAKKQYVGRLDRSYAAHRYPLTRMQLHLLDDNGTTVDVISLSPATAYGGQDLSQILRTSVTSGVVRAVMSFHTDDGADVFQAVVLE